MDREWLKKTGHIGQEAYIRRIEYKEGRACGLRACLVKAGPLSFTVGEDKCLDIMELSWKGTNCSFLSKPGLQNRQHYDSNGLEAQRSIMGGMFFTCGTDNVGSPVTEDGAPLPMHGSLRSTPAEHVCTDCFWDGEEYRMRISGEMRQAALFGGNLVLRRSLETVLGSREIHIHDEYENQSYAQQPFMLLYHFNIGYPLLDEGVQVRIPSRTATSAAGGNRLSQSEWGSVTAPVDMLPEEVFYHELQADVDGSAEVSVYNDRLRMGLAVRFDTKQLPRFTQWKSMASGDYVMGFEPCNCHVKGRLWEKENKTLLTIAAGEKKTVDLSLIVI